MRKGQYGPRLTATARLRRYNEQRNAQMVRCPVVNDIGEQSDACQNPFCKSVI